jgi:hypothetical protein
MARQIPGATVNLGEALVTMPNGGTAQVRSADDPESLRGEGLDFVVLDECAFMAEAAWQESLRPALSDRVGKALFISTPKGRNWFWRLYQRGQDDAQHEWASWQRPSRENPFLKATEIDAAQRELPERVYQQEYEALFLEDSGAVFRGVMAAAVGLPQDPIAGHDYVMGVDWGKSNDFTVIAVGDTNTKRMVAMDRFNQIDYRVQRGRLATLAERYNPGVIMAESNSMGEPIIEQLQADGLPVRGFQTTNATKAAIIEALGLAVERSEITLLNDPVLVGEMQAYEMDRLPSGMVRYSAPEGMHDDTVMATALMWNGMSNSGPLILWGDD